jgi:predicted site-specific integrase-resolvase
VGYVKVAELAERLQIQVKRLYEWIKEGKIASSDFIRHAKRGVILIRDEPHVIQKIQKLKQT